MRNKIDPNQHSFWERFLINIPFILIVALIVAFLGAGSILFVYSFVTIAAFKSSMIFLIIFGGSLFFVGIGLLLIIGFNKYHVFYEKKMDIFQPVQIKTETSSNKSLKDYFTFSNISYGILMLGAVFCIISALLGSTNREKWVEDITPYIESNNYYADVKLFDVNYYIDYDNDFKCDYDSIQIELIDKEAVIIYTDDDTYKGKITINSYIQYQNQISVSNYLNDGIISIVEKQSPEINKNTLNKMLFFIFKDNYFEKQVKIYIPSAYKDEIEIERINNSETIVAK